MTVEPTAGLDAEAFRAAFRHAPLAAALVGADGRVRAVNPALESLVAVATGAPLGDRPLLALLDLPGADVAADGPAGARLGSRCLEVHATRTGDDWLVQLVDVTARVEREQSLSDTVRRLEDIIDNSAALIYVKDTEGRYEFVNRHFARRFGFDPAEVVGRTDEELFPADAAAVYRCHDEHVLRAGEAIEVEEPVTDVDGGSWLSIKFPITDRSGRRYAVGGISTDISDRKLAEAAAREARDEAERANRAKSEFLSRMSHELRTPLNAILGFGQLLSFEPMQPQGRESVDRIMRAGEHLLALINEVLDITRIEAGAHHLDLAPVHACEPLVEALELVRPLAVESGIELVVDLHGGLHRYVTADLQRLKQILLNLLTNAVKYNRPQGVVRTFMHETEPGFLRILVVDTGPGLTEDEATRVFLPFERLGADGTPIEGSGLGLTLSKSLAEAMGGRLGIEHTAVGDGSTFYLELPLCEAPSTTEPDPKPVAVQTREWSLGTARVLYVEDNLSNLSLVEGIFSRVGDVELIPAMQGLIGVDLAVQHAPDVILLDLHLPDVDGAEVLRRLKDDPRTASIPVVMLSADATPGQMERLEAAGAFAYLTKPLRIETFIDTLQEALGLGAT
jgi:PAS domain S-box-containing protein